MRASSSWIKLQFVVRKHVMNTYQMHTLSLLLFYHILTTSRSPFAALFDFLVFLTLPPVSPAHFLSVFLMVCHTDGTYPAVLYNVPLYMYMCMHIPAHIFRVPILYMWCVCDRVVFHCHFFIAVYHHISISDHFLRVLDDRVQTLSAVSGHFMLSLTLSRASAGTTSSAGCNGVGLVRWSGQGRTRIHSYFYWLHRPTVEATTHLGLWGEKGMREWTGTEGKKEIRTD